VAFDNPRTGLAQFVAPGRTHVAVVEVPLDAPGDYAIEFDLVQEAVTWFAERGGGTAVAHVTAE
jgi:hypothetical protein